MARAHVALVLAACLAWTSAAEAQQSGLTYQGHYANAFLAGTAGDGRSVAIMGGFHVDFPYHHRGSGYDQIAVLVEGERPVVATGRPKLPGFRLDLGRHRTRISFRGTNARFALELESVAHPPRYEGDPLDIGDLLLGLGLESDRRPGLVYTPYQLTGLTRGSLTLRSRRGRHPLGARTITLRGLHGQAEAGEIDAPTDRRFRSAYDYLAAATLRGRPYTYVGFRAGALHSGPDGVLGPYFAATASDDFTLENGRAEEDNVHAAPAPFENTRRLPPGSRVLARWRTDLGPGVLYRALVRLRDGDGRVLIGLSETIREDRDDGG